MIMARPSAGFAYGVFRCSDPRPVPALLARFKEALENVKRAHEETKIPPETQFTVFSIRNGVAYIRGLAGVGTEGLLEKIAVVEKKGANFIIHSCLPDAPNEIAARDLGDTLNMLYGGTELFDNENAGLEKPIRLVFYEHDGQYVTRS